VVVVVVVVVKRGGGSPAEITTFFCLSIGVSGQLRGQSPHYPQAKAVISFALSARRTGHNSYPIVTCALPAPSITTLT
jgi:hypothetical protein